MILSVADKSAANMIVLVHYCAWSVLLDWKNFANETTLV